MFLIPYPIIGHSEGTVVAPRVAVDNPTKVKNIVLFSAMAQNLRDNAYFQYVVLMRIVEGMHHHTTSTEGHPTNIFIITTLIRLMNGVKT